MPLPILSPRPPFPRCLTPPVFPCHPRPLPTLSVIPAFATLAMPVSARQYVQRCCDAFSSMPFVPPACFFFFFSLPLHSPARQRRSFHFPLHRPACRPLPHFHPHAPGFSSGRPDASLPADASRLRYYAAEQDISFRFLIIRALTTGPSLSFMPAIARLIQRFLQ